MREIACDGDSVSIRASMPAPDAAGEGRQKGTAAAARGSSPKAALRILRIQILRIKPWWEWTRAAEQMPPGAIKDTVIL